MTFCRRTVAPFPTSSSSRPECPPPPTPFWWKAGSRGPTWAPWRGLLSTGRKVDFPMCLIFEFEGDMMVNERLYFNIGTPLAQLGVAYDPDSWKGKLAAVVAHPVTMAKAILRNIWLAITRRKP